MAISLRQTLTQLATHTHTYALPLFHEATYQNFLSFPGQYGNMLVEFREPGEPSTTLVPTGPPNYSSSSASEPSISGSSQPTRSL